MITLSRARCSCVSIRYDCRSPPRAGTKHRQKGNRVERQIVHLLRSRGIDAERVPLSGAAGGSFSGDILIAGKYRAEVKARSNGQGFRMLEAWLEGSDLLILKRDRRPPIVVMAFDAYARLLHSTLCTTQVLGPQRTPYGTLMPSMGSGCKRDRDHRHIDVNTL